MSSVLKYLFLIFSGVLFGSTETPSSAEWIKSGTVAVVSTVSAGGLYFVPTPVCAWCKPNAFDEKIGRALAVENLERAAIGSHILTLGVVPLAAFAAGAGVSRTRQQFALNALILFDSAMTTLAITQAIKVSTRRERPEVHFGFNYQEDRRRNQSFLSGHTSLAFSLLSTASVLAFRENAPWAGYFTSFAACAGLLVGYSRLNSAKHWASDVLAGMGLGIAVGTIMPFLLFDSAKKSEVIALRISPLLVDKTFLIQVSLRGR